MAVAASVLLVSLAAYGLFGRHPVDPASGEFALIDGDSAWHLRRVGLSISTPRLPQVDGFLSFPHSSPALQLPLYDEAVGLLLRAFTWGAVGAPGRGYDEVVLRQASLWIGPVFLLLWLALLLRFARGNTKGGPWGALAALGLLALSPQLMSFGAPGVLSLELLLSLLFVLQMQAVVSIWRAKHALDQFTSAMFAGVISGLGLALSPAFLIPIIAVWASFLVATRSASKEERGDLLRAALLFWIATSLGGLMPSIGGPWAPAGEGAITGWTELWGKLGVAGMAPFLLLLWRPNWGSPALNRFASWAPGALLVATGGAIFQRMGADHPSTALLHAAFGLDAASPNWLDWELALVLLLWASVVFLVWGRCLKAESTDRAEGSIQLCLGLVASMSLMAACVHPPVILFLAVPVAYFGARAFDGPGDSGVIGAFAFVSLGIGGLLHGQEWDSKDKQRATEVLAAARVLRDEVGASESWRSVNAVHREAILADPELAPLLVYHAKLPCATLGRARNGDSEGRFRLEEVVRSSSVETLLARARESGLRHLLIAPESAERWARFGANAQVFERLRQDELEPAWKLRVLWSSPQQDPAERSVLLALD